MAEGRLLKLEEDGRLFGFQRQAAQFCLSHLRAGRPCILALGTGCGKTLTIREVVLLLGRPRTLLLAPGGLCRQIAGSISEPPWARRGAADEVRAAYAETGRQLQALAASRREGVIVANYKVRNLGEVLDWPELVVVDEAHLATLSLLSALQARAPLLLSTATPFEVSGIRRFFAARRLDARACCFLFAKTPEVMRALGTATLEITPSWSDAAAPLEYYERLVASLAARSGQGQPLSVVMCLLAVAAVAREEPAALDLVLEALGKALGDAVQRSGLYLFGGRSFFHEATASHALAERLVASRLASLGALEALEPRLRACVERSAALEGDRGVGELPGFGVTPAEYDQLYACHMRVSRRGDLWPEGRSAMFSTALVRVPNMLVTAHAERVRSKHPDVKVFELHTGMSASQRALAVRRFASHDGERASAKLCIEGLRRNGSDAAKTALSLGGGWVALQIYRYLAHPRLLVADDSVDVGWALHRHVDTVLLPHVLPDRTTLLQLLGRVSRIDVDRAHQGSIAVHISLTRGTLDCLFERRMREDVVVEQEEPEPRRHQVLNEEMASAFLAMAESDLQRAWLQHLLRCGRQRRP